MSAWPTDLRGLIDAVRDEFGVTGIEHPEGLDHALQTGFVWTRQPGVACLASNRHYLRLALDNPDVRVIITPSGHTTTATATDKCVIACRDAESLYLHLHASQQVDDDTNDVCVDDSALVDASVVMRGKVTIGADVRIGPRVVICGPATIGQGVCIEPGAIVGCDGLYAKTLRGKRRHMPHYGGITIGRHAFIHAGAAIVRSTIRGEATHIGRDAHIGIMSNIGHDAAIGDEATISSHCVIAGRARVGAGAWIGASATVSNMVHVGDRAKVRLGAVVIRDVPADADVSGNFASSHAHTMRTYLKESGRAP